MKSILMLTLTIIMGITSVTAQKVTGTVKAEGDGPIEKASVSLLRAKDSTVVKLSISDKTGRYGFEGIANGAYLVSATSIGYSPAYTAVFNYNGENIELPQLSLAKANSQLQGVTVTARKPLVEVRADKMIVNVEGTINATGNDGLELLRRSPGVLVDKDENISMAGKSGVQIYIDGKPSPLRGADLASYLKSMQSANIESIELITNPSAKYEAAGNGGIINIKLKKNKNFGTNGSVNAGYNIGKLPKYNGGFTLNHRNKNINIFGNYNYYKGDFYSTQNIYREQADSVFDQNGIMKFNRNSHNFKAGLDYFINAKNTIGVMANGNIATQGFTNEGPMSIAAKATGVVNRILKTNTEMDGSRNNINLNLNYRYANNDGRELNVDADYGYYKNRSNQYIPSIYYKPDGVTELSRNISRIVAPTDIDLFAVKADYQQKLGKGVLGFGGKSGYVKTDNHFNQYDVINNNDVLDINKSNQFKYTESINALYVSYNRSFKGYAIQVGLRGENTDSKGESINRNLNYDSLIHRNYTDFFPSASITFNKNPMSQFSVSYSRRIDRPSYENLNPFEFRLNDYLYMKGNTQLRPQYTNTFGVTHTYKYKLTTQLNYSHVKDMFAQILDEADETKAYQTTRNLNTQDVVSLVVSYPFIYKQVFTSFNNLTANYSHFQDNANGKKLNLNNFNVQYFMQNSLKFGKKKDWTAELTGLYLSPFVWQGTFKGKAMGSVDFGLQKNILKDKGTLKASVTDIFKTMHFRGDMSYGQIYSRVAANWESRQFKLSFNYRFGNAQVKAARQRKSAAEEERNRTNGGSATPGAGGQ